MQPDSLLSHIPSDHGSTLPVAQSIEPLGVTEHGFLNEQKLSKLTTYTLYTRTYAPPPPPPPPYKHMYTRCYLYQLCLALQCWMDTDPQLTSTAPYRSCSCRVVSCSREDMTITNDHHLNDHHPNDHHLNDHHPNDHHPDIGRNFSPSKIQLTYLKYPLDVHLPLR